eukprot:TRINITY_DN61932_c0_g1_i1.p1 TRINITY_DN61932_c0_g1~~TRINITY_DN61932_c0_g1_i1.p1  ORF type:complete len:253 (+),score=32.15 TRINITY_DN61932_c0_g1_i1:75-833(+)
MVGDPQFDIVDKAILRSHIGEPGQPSKERLKFTKELTESQTQFISRSPFCMLSTLDPNGVPFVSPKGDGPAFVQILSPKLLLLPERPGNKLIFTLENILQHADVQLLFMVPNTCETLRVSGRASLSRDPSLCRLCAAGGQDALLVIRLAITECFYHCAKSLIRSQLWNPATWPTDRFKVPLGKQMAEKSGESARWAQELEAGMAQRLKDIEGHYREQVWNLRSEETSRRFVAMICGFALMASAVAGWKRGRA